MAFAFYQLSGGDDFVPIAEEKRALAERLQEEKRLAEAAAKAKREEALIAAKPKPAPLPDVPTTKVVLASASVEPLQTTDANAALNATIARAADATVATAQAESEVEPEVARPKDIREVSAARVNMRTGPGRTFSVLTKLSNGEKVEILQDPGSGWVKLRVVDSGRVGWMANSLLTASNTE